MSLIICLKLLIGGGLMSDDQAKITIVCSRELKRKAKQAMLNKGIDMVQDGYLQIFQLGLKHFNKSSPKDKDKEGKTDD
jgi:hypothetical protein